MTIYEIHERTDNLLNRLVTVWEDSVRATHLFLSDEEIKKIKEYVPEALRSVAHLITAGKTEDCPVAFMGIEEERLEMLFISSAERSAGLGGKLIEYAIKNYGIKEVTVNEQNPQAVGFYRHMCFETYKRTELDEEGNPYPLLYMRLSKQSDCSSDGNGDTKKDI